MAIKKMQALLSISQFVYCEVAGFDVNDNHLRPDFSPCKVVALRVHDCAGCDLLAIVQILSVKADYLLPHARCVRYEQYLRIRLQAAQ